MAIETDSLFRSAPMVLVQLYLANEIGRESVSSLGELGVVQFRDLNPDTSAFQRTFTQEIRRLDNVERQLNYFREQITKNDIPMRSIYDFADNVSAPSASEIDELAERSEQLEQRIRSLNESYETLKRREMELTEWRWVLREAGNFFDRARGQTSEIRQSIDSDDDAPLLRDVEQATQEHEHSALSVMNIGFVAGTIPQAKKEAFERILWRTLRGNLYMNHTEIPDPIVNPENNEEQKKDVFVVYTHGQTLVQKIKKIAESLGANIYNVDENTELRREQIHEVNSRLQDLSQVLGNTKRTLDAELTQMGRSLVGWMIIIKKEKGVYQTLNRFSFDPARKTLVAEAWLPRSSLPHVKAALQDVNDRAGLSVPTIVNQLSTTKTPPTYFKVNKFTTCFQSIVDSYGTAQYGEFNQALVAIITLPFLYSVMAGDVLHGFITTVAAIAMIYYEKPLQRGKQDELFGLMFAGRYMILLFGLFAMYSGAIYSDIGSKPIPFAKSMWQWNAPANWKEGDKLTAERVSYGYTYPFGLDFQWHDTDNDLLFSNSLKMKASILLGYSHMSLSLFWSFVNARHFKSFPDIVQTASGYLFLNSFIGYLCFCIVYKWSVDWYAIGAQPPSLLNLLINMFLKPGTIEERLYSGQGPVQVILVLVAVIQIPVMLLFKPFYLRWEHNKARAQGYRGIGDTSHVSAVDDDDDDDASHANGRPSEEANGVVLTQDIGDGEHEEFEFSEAMIHQVIHTIEFCLNCVSHTASYLRLWALSLAHQQLSIVLWDMTLSNAFPISGALGIIATFLFFGVWFALTIAVLVIMEGTSAFLHALRLHWVEAMSKHFVGDGIAFEPFSFQAMLDDELTELK